MSKNLVIVESPAKAKTIEKFLGKDYHVLSSQGHIRDIDKDGKNSIGIDFQNHYAPHYAIDPQKHRLIAELQKAVKSADKVWLASDEDREGEAIAWHLQQVLNLPQDETNRIVFHEITKTAIQDAIAHPRKIDYHLVNAQQARRVVDRIVGYELSPVLWRKVATGLSAGRVQSVAVRLIVEREREIDAFEPTAQYRITADFTGKDAAGKTVTLHTELNHRFATHQEAEAYLQACVNAEFTIRTITHKPSKRTPAPPFTTSTLQQEAARKLHFSVSRTMRLAQSLYEAGHITYMRTDSVNLSSLAIGTAQQVIEQTYGADYHKARQYHTSTKGAQEAHEAIRPTYIATETAGDNNDQRRLYDLIRKRTLACQMADAQIENTRIEVTADGLPHQFVATGEVVLFDGFMRAYIQGGDEEETENTKALPRMNEQTALLPKTVTARQSFTKAPLRFTEASLVKRMEELGIGRPSTYAATIETILQRNYVHKGEVPGKQREVDCLTLKQGQISTELQAETYGQDSGNLLKRTIAMSQKYFGGVVENAGADEKIDEELKELAIHAYENFAKNMDEYRIADAIEGLIAVLRRANKYIDETMPWVLYKDESNYPRLKTVLYNLTETLVIITSLLDPIMPETAEKALKQLNSPFRKYEDMGKFGLYASGTKVTDNAEIIFNRLDIEEVYKKAEEIENKYAAPEEKPEMLPEISIDDFAKVQLKTALVTACEKVEKSKKLLKLSLKVGGDRRTVVSGIAEYYKPEELIGKTVVMVYNLKPAKLCGVESQGMILCAEKDGKVKIIESELPDGSTVR